MSVDPKADAMWQETLSSALATANAEVDAVVAKAAENGGPVPLHVELSVRMISALVAHAVARTTLSKVRELIEREKAARASV